MCILAIFMRLYAPSCHCTDLVLQYSEVLSFTYVFIMLSLIVLFKLHPVTHQSVLNHNTGNKSKVELSEGSCRNRSRGVFLFLLFFLSNVSMFALMFCCSIHATTRVLSVYPKWIVLWLEKNNECVNCSTLGSVLVRE